MTRFYIEDIRRGQESNGMACGPVSGVIIAEAKIKTREETYYICLTDVDGIPIFFKTKDSTFDRQLSLEEDDDEFVEMMNNCFIDTGEYEEILEKRDDEMFPLYKFLTYIVNRASEEELKLFKGKYLDEVDIPESCFIY